MTERARSEAELQRTVVTALRFILPRDAILHHSPNEVALSGAAAARRQAMLTGMGVHPGFADLIILAQGRVLFLELKSRTGALSAAQEAFRQNVVFQGHCWAVVRNLDDALGALYEHGITTRVITDQRASPARVLSKEALS